jgi:hypothetical protein
VATDVNWAHGVGSLLVYGKGEALLMACSGRTVAFAELHVAGADLLRSRL